MDKSLGTVVQFERFLTHAKLYPRATNCTSLPPPLPHGVCWNRQSTIPLIFQHCIGLGGGRGHGFVKWQLLLFATLLVKRIELKLRSDCQFCAFHVAKCTAIIIVGPARNLKLLQWIIVNESSFYFSFVTFILCLSILCIVPYLSINFNIKKN